MVIEGPEKHQVTLETTATKEGTEKVDSGMEEENSENLMLGDSSDDEEGEIVMKKVNKSKQRLILDEDSDESDMETSKAKTQTFTAEQALQAVLADSDDDKDVELLSSTKKRKIKRPVDDDSSGDEGLDLDLKSTQSTVSDQTIPDNKDGNVSVADNSTMMDDDNEESFNQRPDKEPEAIDSDSSGSRSSSGSDSDNSDQDNADNDDEGFNEGSVDPKLLAKLKKGACKKPRDKSARISKQGEMMSLHSESQRIVREGRVNLPYHQPAPKSLNVFLARANKKQQEYRSLKGGVRDSRKAKVIEDVLQKSRIQAQQKTQEEQDKYSDSDDDWDPIIEKETSLKERVNDRLKQTDECTDVSEDCQQVSTSQGEGIDHDKQSNPVNDKGEKGDEEDLESLPDISDAVGDVGKAVVNSEIVNRGPTLPDLNTEENAVSDISDNNKSDKLTDELLFEWEKPDESDIKSNTNTAEGDTDVIGDVDMVNKENSSKDLIDKTKNTLTNDSLLENEKTISKDNNLLDDKENIPKDNVSESTEKDSETDLNQEKSSPVSKSDKRLKKEKLLALAGIDLNIVQPRLSGATETFISLAEEDEVPQHPGVVKLMDRLTKHTAKREKKHSKDLDISIVSKDKVGMNKEELQLNTFTYHVEEEDSNPLMKLETPGAKLLALKEQLKDKIKEKREVARQKRQELYNLDNEECDEEEGEMSDHSDTDVEDEEFEEQYGGEAEYDEEEELIEEKPREKNPFADEEAEDDGLDEEEGMEDDDENDEDHDDKGDDDGDADEEEMNLKLDLSDEEEDAFEEEKVSKEKPVTMKKSSSSLGTSSVCDTRDTTEFKEPSPRKLPDKPFSMFGQRSRDNSFTDSQIQSGQKPPSLRLQIEDSQDLYGTLPQLAPTQEPANTQSSPQNFNFFLEDSQSVMLDAEGYLKTKSTGKKKVSMISALDDLSNTQDDMGDVMGLCSGKFVTQGEVKDKSSKKSLFDESSASNTQKDMAEFMGLCSGVFTDRKDSSQMQGTKRKASSDGDDDSIEALSDNENRQSDKDNQSGEEGDRDTDHLEEEEDEEEKPQQFTGFLQKKGKLRKEFVEDEAELSGSEFGSDEDLDIPEEEDILELEEADKEMAGVNQEDLRDEVGRVHLKQLIDEDKRELLRFQEMYLADGDLHSEGGGRIRRFKWSNMDDDTQQDMFGDTSDGEGPEHEDPEETQWRKERYEREKFLKEQQEKEMNDSDNSQFFKFGQVFLKKQVSVDGGSGKKDKPESQSAVQVSGNPSNQADTPGFPSSFYKLSKQKRGSFLARSKKDLAKIAEMTKPIANPSAGAKSSGNFTFQVISPNKNSEKVPSPTKKQRKAHVPTTPKQVSNFKKPPLKKQKLDENSQNSVFNHLY